MDNTIEETAFEFLRSQKEVAFATIEDNKPKIRTFQIMKQEEKSLYFTTAPGKEVYRQLLRNPCIELLAMKENTFVRIAGEAVFDVNSQTAMNIYISTPILQQLYTKYSDLVYFRVPIRQMDYYDLIPNPPLQEHYDYQ